MNTSSAAPRLGVLALVCLGLVSLARAQSTAPRPSGAKPPAPTTQAPKPAAPKPAAPAPVASARARPSAITGSCNFSPIVADLEIALPFYQRVLGLQVPAALDDERPFDSTTPVLDMLGLRGAEMRWVTARIPGSRCGVEIVEVGKIDRAPRDPQPQDPGAATLVLIVRDVEPIFTRAQDTGARILTTGGVPIAVPSEGGAGILLRDPDGHFVEVLQALPPPPVSPGDTTNVIGWRVRLSVNDTDEALRLYRDRFGLEAKPGALAKNKAFTELNGLPDVPVRITTVTIPGGGRLDLAEYSGVPRTPLAARIQDPGATRLQLQAADVKAAADLAKQAGATVISQDGGIVTLPGGAQATVARDANNLFLVLFASPSK
jgi:catechol 2,3-dioxygenase-like lactoylglutathione lyase family enzyme